jgi:hypothetical protein
VGVRTEALSNTWCLNLSTSKPRHIREKLAEVAAAAEASATMLGHDARRRSPKARLKGAFERVFGIRP